MEGLTHLAHHSVMPAHRTVMPSEAVDALLAGGCRAADGVFVDATFGAGGHSRLLLARLQAPQRLLALDCDETAAQHAARMSPPNFIFARRNFAELPAVLAEQSISQVCGVLFDLGVSSMQLEAMPRGFSFRSSAPLDMRLDRRDGETLQQWLVRQDEAGICEAIRRFGEEPEARNIARAIYQNREQLATTQQLAEVITAACRRPPKPGIHPATQVFQALRIAVNRELEKLQSGLAAACGALVAGGRLVVIAFHSLEDRIVKQLGVGQSLPGLGQVARPRMQAVGKMQRASADEVRANPRARSACMRVFVKQAEGLPC